ncbi:MFS transporter [Pyrinomonas sp.]|uniref:MFS transporter n=1 Tax=Pyrinomonas sp. TaxID=2080306 RepID=UPI0033259CB0
METQVEPTADRIIKLPMFRALAHRNYRFFWAGALLSNVGTWMQTVAQGWLVLQLTDSAFWLGVDGFMATAPGLLLTLLGGVFADQVDKKRLLIWTQVGAGLAALALWSLIVAGLIQLWMILALSFVTGCCMALSSPAYQALTIELVGRDDLSNAIALNSMQFQLSRVIGPVFAGLAINAFGLAGCFLANGLSYIAVVVALVLVQFPMTATVSRKIRRHAIWRDLLQGFRYVQGRPRVRMLLLISAVTSLFGAPYLTMIPIFARDVFQAGETGLATMMAMAGAGAFCGALTLAVLSDFRRKGLLVLGGAFAFALALTAFAFARHWLLANALLFAMGYSLVCCVAVVNMLLQNLVTDRMRGRVMSMFVFSFLGTTPIGNFLTGAVAQRLSAPVALAVNGSVIAAFIVLVAARNQRLRALS